MQLQAHSISIYLEFFSYDFTSVAVGLGCRSLVWLVPKGIEHMEGMQIGVAMTSTAMRAIHVFHRQTV